MRINEMDAKKNPTSLLFKVITTQATADNTFVFSCTVAE